MKSALPQNIAKKLKHLEKKSGLKKLDPILCGPVAPIYNSHEGRVKLAKRVKSHEMPYVDCGTYIFAIDPELRDEINAPEA